MSKKRQIERTSARELRDRLVATAARGGVPPADGVRDMRAIAGMTQEEFARHRGVSTRVIKSIENGQANPTVATLNRIGEFFGLEVAFVPKRHAVATPEDVLSLPGFESATPEGSSGFQSKIFNEVAGFSDKFQNSDPAARSLERWLEGGNRPRIDEPILEAWKGNEILHSIEQQLDKANLLTERLKNVDFLSQWLEKAEYFSNQLNRVESLSKSLKKAESLSAQLKKIEALKVDLTSVARLSSQLEGIENLVSGRNDLKEKSESENPDRPPVARKKKN